MGEKKEFEGKNIIIYIPNDFGLPAMFRDNLAHHGFQVIPLKNIESQKISFAEYCLYTFKKIFLNDRSFKEKAKENRRLTLEKKEHLAQLASWKNPIDFALILRPDLLNDDVLKRIKEKSKKTVGYQWDGFERYPQIRSKLHFFDDFFVFDEKDVNLEENRSLITNFYFDHLLEGNQQIKSDVYFIGSHIANRMPKLLDVAVFLKNKNLKLDINVVGSGRKYRENHSEMGVNFITAPFDFQTNYQHIGETKAVLDLLNDVHSGLSLRVFEALGFRKKLITDNLEIKKYDFYNPEKIFLLQERNWEDLPGFINAPYQSQPENNESKYSFKNWLHHILYKSKSDNS